ncbi:hypothetical protein GHT06_017558 [Daphnia sinensis]|uniref:Uncharacterized protein n=1 Tax=Daphnia sinensis TaxID=1820382 RepID=A0AAD5PV53_9CRUS|nr:hypothetical protein GHT06_017558 [Daphnia sinensis]
MLTVAHCNELAALVSMLYLYLSPSLQLGSVSALRLRKSDLSIQIFVSNIRLVTRQTSEEHLTERRKTKILFFPSISAIFLRRFVFRST